MEEKIKNIRENLDKDIKEVTNLQSLNELRVKYLGKKGLVTELTSNMKDLSIEERKEVGKLSNEIRTYATDLIDSLEEKLKLEELNKKLESEAIDITMPATEIEMGSPSILEKVIEDFESVFMSMGYDVVDGPELEEDRFNFELLGLPKGHPARDAQDTFYVKGDELLLRSHTSPVQARTMLSKGGLEPVRVICPGKAYRRDDDDATHSHQFTQIEGLLVDKDIKLSDLKGTVTAICKHMFGKDTVTRFRPSYYQFTEPSVEMDISCFNCKGKGCNICKNTGWITIGGAGVVHYDVLKGCGYDPEIWSGFAFGFGAERCAMLKYGISDIRTFYNVDLRETQVFDRKESE